MVSRGAIDGLIKSKSVSVKGKIGITQQYCRQCFGIEILAYRDKLLEGTELAGELVDPTQPTTWEQPVYVVPVEVIHIQFNVILTSPQRERGHCSPGAL